MTDEQFLKKLGTKISETRKQKGYTQAELGAKINMEYQNLSAIENGRQNAATLTLKKISDALDCKVEDLFAGIQETI